MPAINVFAALLSWPRRQPFRKTFSTLAVLPPTKPLCLHRWPPSISRWLMNGLSAASHGRIGNGLQWAEEELFFTAVGVRANRSRRSFRSKTCSKRFRRWTERLRGRLLVVEAGSAGGDLKGPDLSGVAVSNGHDVWMSMPVTPVESHGVCTSVQMWPKEEGISTALEVYFQLATA